jgi:hypothetical protein
MKINVSDVGGGGTITNRRLRFIRIATTQLIILLFLRYSARKAQVKRNLQIERIHVNRVSPANTYFLFELMLSLSYQAPELTKLFQSPRRMRLEDQYYRCIHLKRLRKTTNFVRLAGNRIKYLLFANLEHYRYT